MKCSLELKRKNQITVAKKRIVLTVHTWRKKIRHYVALSSRRFSLCAPQSSRLDEFIKNRTKNIAIRNRIMTLFLDKGTKRINLVKWKGWFKRMSWSWTPHGTFTKFSQTKKNICSQGTIEYERMRLRTSVGLGRSLSYRAVLQNPRELAKVAIFVSFLGASSFSYFFVKFYPH